MVFNTLDQLSWKWLTLNHIKTLLEELQLSLQYITMLRKTLDAGGY